MKGQGALRGGDQLEDFYCMMLPSMQSGGGPLREPQPRTRLPGVAWNVDWERTLSPPFLLV